MKKAIGILAALLLLSSASAETWYAFCAPDSQLNLREGAGSGSAYAGYLLCGDAFEAGVSRKDNRGRVWFASAEPMVESGIVYVCADYLSSSPVTVEERTATIMASGRVAVRETPGGKRLRWARPGDTVTAVAYSDSWALTAHGYIRTDCLQWDD